jgi:ribosomal protein S18 acetylase RimI-like enzyme
MRRGKAPDTSSRSQVKVRRVSEADLERLVTLWTELARFHEPLDPSRLLVAGASERWREHVEPMLRSDDHRVLVAETPAEGVIGFAIGAIAQRAPIFERPQYGLIADVYVEPRSRRRGAGQRLFEELRDWFAARGVTNMELTVVSANSVGQAFWRALGFRGYMDRLQRQVVEGEKCDP